MSRSDRVRRAVSLTLAVLAFLVVPQLAFGQFSSGQAPTLQVGMATLVTPTVVSGTYQCRVHPNGKSEGADVTVTGLAAAGQPSGVSYLYTLYRGATPEVSTSSSALPVALSTGLARRDAGDTTYRLTLVAKIGTWTAPEYSRSFTCGGSNPGSGSL